MSVNAQAHEAYRSSNVVTASQGKLLLMLYDAAINGLKTARKAIIQQDVQEAHNHLIKVQRILVEFMCTLNMDYDISKNLLALYQFMYEQLVQANVNKEAGPIDQVLPLLSGLREAWAQAAKDTASAPAPAAAAVGKLDLKG